MLSKLECLLNDVKGKIFNPDYNVIKKAFDMSKDPELSKDEIETQIILTYYFLSKKVENSNDYLAAGKIKGLTMLKNMRNLLNEYILRIRNFLV